MVRLLIKGHEVCFYAVYTWGTGSTTPQLLALAPIGVRFTLRLLGVGGNCSWHPLDRRVYWVYCRGEMDFVLAGLQTLVEESIIWLSYRDSIDENFREYHRGNAVYSWRMPSSGVSRRVALLRTEVTEEYIASLIRIKRISELEATLAVTSSWSTLRRNIISALTMTMLCSEMSVLTRATDRLRREDGILHSHCRENLKSCTVHTY
jgi:hypothetical protein